MLISRRLAWTQIWHDRSQRLAGAIALTIATGLIVFPSCVVQADQPIAPPTCALRLSVEVTLDVPNPSDPGFISSLLGEHPGYQLFLLNTVDDSHVILQLQGPGEAERCQAVVDSMRNDGRVASIDIIS